MKVTFTIYFHNKVTFERTLREKNIPFETSKTLFIQWYSIDESFKSEVNSIIVSNGLQDGMVDEFKWNGWSDWADGQKDRDMWGRKTY